MFIIIIRKIKIRKSNHLYTTFLKFVNIFFTMHYKKPTCNTWVEQFLERVIFFPWAGRGVALLNAAYDGPCEAGI